MTIHGGYSTIKSRNTYQYSAWGELLSTTGSMASTIGATNPLRYRGYYFDSETGFYYLQSRYYDPVTCRFINADNYASTGQGIISNNMFAYCLNNPVNLSDNSGNWPEWATIVLGAVAAVAAVAATVVTLGAAAPAAMCTLAAVGTSIGASYAVASAAATAAVVVTTTAAAAYAGDVAYSSVTGDSLLLDTVFQGNVDAYNTGLEITSILTFGMLEAAAHNPGVCFIAGTPIQTATGTIPIQLVVAGDLVWAWDEETGEVALKEVVETYVNETDELIHVFVNGEEIVTTPSHPFYSPVKGWTDAVHLRAGDILVLVNGEYVVVEKIQHEFLESPVTVYNFQVEDCHTYYVSNMGVLVHNTCATRNTKTTWDLQKYSKGTQKVNFQGKSMTAHFDGKYYWLDDLAGHGTNGSSSFKVFRKTGKYLEWYADADSYGNFIIGKHKGPTGLKLRLD